MRLLCLKSCARGVPEIASTIQTHTRQLWCSASAVVTPRQLTSDHLCICLSELLQQGGAFNTQDLLFLYGCWQIPPFKMM